MKKLIVFNNLSLDGYFCDDQGDMSWAHASDPEWVEWTSQNAGRGGVLVFGRRTYEQMASFWPTEQAARLMPPVAKAMNEGRKVVFSRTMERADWNNTELVRTDIVAAMKRLKAEAESDLVIMGSGTIVAQMAAAGLVDVYQLVVHPLVLGKGRTLFEGVGRRLQLHLEEQRRFANGNLVLTYCATASA